jgi:hypothetical protein
VLGGESEVSAAWAAAHQNQVFKVEGPDFGALELSLGEEAERFGLPVVPEWADWFMGELKRRRAICPLAGLGCSPVLVTRTKARFLSWISRGLRRGAIKFP